MTALGLTAGTDGAGDARTVAGGRPSAARERLLATASELFYAEGIRAVGVDRIVTAAAVTRATFYRHFPGKEDLVVAYLRSVDAAVHGALRGSSGEALVRRLAGGTGDQLCRPGYRGCPFLNAAAEHPDPRDPVHRAVIDHRSWLLATVHTAFAEAGHPEPARAADRFFLLRDGAMAGGHLGDPVAASLAYADAVEDLLGAARRSGRLAVRDDDRSR